MKQHYIPYLKGLCFFAFSLLTWQELTASLLALDSDYTLACNETIYLSLDNNCEAVITPDLLINSTTLSNPYRIFITMPIDSLGNNYSNNDTDRVKLLKIGEYIYKIMDDLGNACTGNIIVEDIIAPVVICSNDLVISAANEEGVILDAETVDGGSFDDCGQITKAIRIKGMDTTWQSAIFLPCELIDSLLRIELKITDAAGNENFCWASVQLTDKIKPTCQNLQDEVITCDVTKANDYGQPTDANNNKVFEEEEWQNMTVNQQSIYNETFGFPICMENITCKDFFVEQQYQRLENACGRGQIRRRYRGVDAQGNIGDWATQQIMVNYQANWTITFAPDWEGSCKETIPPPFIAFQNGACDNLSFNVTENTFPADEDYCIKVERIYQVTNPCLLNPVTTPLTILRLEDRNGNVGDSLKISSDSLGGNAHFFYKQILKIRSTEKPNLTIQNIETCLAGIPIDSIFLKVDSLEHCAENRTFRAVATDCIGNSIARFQWEFYENERLIDNGIGAAFTKAVLPNIDYTVQFTAIDACNNETVERRDFTFLDCVQPILFIRTRLALELKEKEHIIKAADFDIGSYDNCTDKTTLLNNFRIWHDKLGFDYPEDLATIKTLPASITFTCAELATQEVFIYTFDAADNFDFVSAFVIIQDNQESCLVRDRASVTGQIMTEKGGLIEQVNINLSGAMKLNKVTNDNGQYLFDLPKGQNYTVEPSKDIHPLAGITTFDLILINKHILGITPFSSPYQHIAADINKSGTITAFDLVQLRQLILNIITDFPTNSSWRFVDNSYEFVTQTPENEPFAEKIAITNIAADHINFDFIGIKIGDIDGSSAVPNDLDSSIGRAKQETFPFIIEDQLVKSGQQFDLPFIGSNVEHIEGLQFALNFSGLNLINLTEGIATAEHFNLEKLDQGYLMISWHKTVNLIANQPLFTLTFRAENEGLLSELLQIIPDDLAPEAYMKEQKVLNLSLQFTAKRRRDKFELFQNKPNPFYKVTTIPFYLPKPESVQLRILNLRGEVLKTMIGDYGKGFQEIKINQQSLGVGGVLYYQLIVGECLTTKKMILLN